MPKQAHVLVQHWGQPCYVQRESFDVNGDGKPEDVIAVQPEAGGPAQRFLVDSDEAKAVAAEHPEVAALLSGDDAADDDTDDDTDDDGAHDHGQADA